MIIATALGKLFNGKTANVKMDGQNVSNHPISYHYGDQKELLLWLKLRDNKAKYPLVWYVLNSYTELNGTYKTDATLVIMQNTDPIPLNTWREVNTYTGIIEPTWQVLKDTLITNLYIQIVSDTLEDKFRIKDEPNYGVSSGVRELEAKTANISTNIVDARVVRFNLEIQAKCII